MKMTGFWILVLSALFLTTKPLAFAASDSAPYDTLLISGEEKHLIAKLLTTMADNNVIKLLFEKKKLEKIGERIHHVHPMRFLGTVFTDGRLSSSMKEISRSGFKWDGFMEGFAERMRGEAKRGNLLPYVPGFAEAVHRNPEEIAAYIERLDFEGLVKYLIN